MCVARWTSFGLKFPIGLVGVILGPDQVIGVVEASLWGILTSRVFISFPDFYLLSGFTGNPRASRRCGTAIEYAHKP